MELFSVVLAICAGNSRVTHEFPAQRPVAQRFDVFHDLRPNKRLSKQSWGWWFEAPSLPLWRHIIICKHVYQYETPSCSEETYSIPADVCIPITTYLPDN